MSRTFKDKNKKKLYNRGVGKMMKREARRNKKKLFFEKNRRAYKLASANRWHFT